MSGTTLDPKGGLVNMINLYSYGGAGIMIELRLKGDKNECPGRSSFSFILLNRKKLIGKSRKAGI